MTPSQPNILLILADDLGYSDLGCYGSEIHTPNLDRLAASGSRFTQFYNNALCAPTRASLLTGLYPHEVGPEGSGPLDKNGHNITLAELLRSVDYRTLMAGKWHSGHQPGQRPTDRGFDRYWGLLSGCSNYFRPGLQRPGEEAPVHKRPGDMRPWGSDDQLLHPFTPSDPDFYTTDAFTDHALEFLDTYGLEDRPFFLYLSHCAPHFPMHARPEDIDRYRGKYLVGWDEIRNTRYQRLKELGIIDQQWPLSPRSDRSPPWNQVTDKADWDLKMAVYAAMVDRMDQGIGKVLDKIRDLGKESDTLVIFFSDNGACSEAINRTPDVPPGPFTSYRTVDAPWANASNTPFRLFKAFDHEGGISTPAIASWPSVITPGEITTSVTHIMDLMPTFAEISGASYPESYDGNPVLPFRGQSLVPILQGQSHPDRPPLFWELRGCRAVRQGNWKLVTQGPERDHVGLRIPPNVNAWELYNIESDRCELNDLSTQLPEKVHELESLWTAWSPL